MAEAGVAGGANNVWRGTVAAMCVILAGIGLARFAYTPLIPALVAAGWFTPGQAAYLGAANLAGYLLGAVVARPLAARLRAVSLLRAMMVLTSVSFVACAVPLSFAWFFLWRLTAGLTGAVLMVLAAPSVLPHVPVARRGLAGGIIFTGVGIGIAVSGSLVPLFLQFGLVAAWLGLGALAAMLTVIAWSGWPDAAKDVKDAPSDASARVIAPRALVALYIGYALNAAGLVPHVIFLVDFVARGLGQGIAAGAWQWVLFGLGAVAGPVLLGRLADRIGFAASVRLAYAVEAACIALLSVTANGVVLALTSVVVGAYVPGITTLTLGRARELLPGGIDRQRAAWSVATAAFALGQAVAAYGFSYLFVLEGSYTLLFALGAAAIVTALVIDVAAA